MDIEKSLLSHIIDQSSFQKMWDQGVREFHFDDPLNQKIFEFSVEYWLRERMEKVPTKDVLLSEWSGFEFVETEESVVWLIDKLFEKYTRNKVEKVIRGSASSLVEEDDPSGALSELYSGSWAIKQDLTPRVGRVNLGENILERRKRFEERALFKDNIRGIGWGLPEIDNYTNGLLKGELGVIAGFAKTGKSFALCKIAVEAHKAGEVPYLATLELDTDDFSDRIDSMNSGISYAKLQKGLLTPSEIKKLHESQEEMKERGPFFVEKPHIGERTVQYIVNRARQLGATIILIDQLSFMEPRETRKHIDKKSAVDEIIMDLKNEISVSDAPIPCYLAVQFNRASRGQRGERGEMHHIGISSLIEQTADILYGLSRPKEYRMNNSLLLDIMGSRRSDVGSWLMKWELSDEATVIDVREKIEEVS